MALVLLSQTSRTRSPRALISHSVDDEPQLISLMVQHTNPGLACSPDKAQVEVPSSAGGSTNVSSREVSKYGGSAARRRPNLSITSPYESIVDSTCRQPLKADCRFCTGRFYTVPPSFARLQNTSRLESDCFHTPNLFTKPSFAPSTHEPAFLSNRSPNTILFSLLCFSFCPLASKHEHAFSQRSRQTPPLSSTSSPWPHPPSRLGGAYRP